MMKIVKTTLLSMIMAASVSTAEAAVPRIDTAGMAPYVTAEATPRSASLRYMPDGESFLRISPDRKAIIRYDVKSGKQIDTLMNVRSTRTTKINRVGGFSMSADGKKFLVYEDAEPIYRNSFKAKHYLYDAYRNTLRPLSEDHPVQQVPTFSPDARMVSFVADDNNIYLKKLDYWTETPVTTDGKVNEVINGVPDWTYQEEFKLLNSMVWSPDNSTLCFIKFNEKNVKAFSFPLYQGSCNPMNQYALYPGSFTYKYPVAGEVNSKVSVHSYDVANRKTKQITLPDATIEYIPRIDYGPTAEQLVVTTLDRDQNRMELYMANPKSTVVKSILVEKWKAWINPDSYESTVFGPDGFVVMSDRTGYTHLYKYSYTGQLVKTMTKGDYDVTAYYGTSADGSYYYQTTGGNPLNRIVTKVDRKGVSTRITPAEGTASAVFAPGLKYYTVNYSNAQTPPEYTLYNALGKKLRVLEDNADYKTAKANIPAKEFFTFTSDGNTLNGYVIKPVNFNSGKRYPVIMVQYSGPGSQSVRNAWSCNFEHYYATQGFVVVCVDGRGTGGRGRAFMDVVYRNLGHYETIDQVAGARYVASLPYVDAKRIGIYGWSYGGYEALMCATQPGTPFAAAVAVAPVTDWRYYDTVYAERYMLTPQQNEDGYNASAPVKRAVQLGCPTLVMHGTADDNVHVSNAIEFVSALEAASLTCDMLLFPNMNHSINGCNSRYVVYGRMLEYFKRNM